MSSALTAYRTLDDSLERAEFYRMWRMALRAGLPHPKPALAMSPADEFERALLALGEESGRLEDCLRLLGEYFTRKHKLMLWVKKKMAYPLMTGLAASFIAPLPLLYFGHSRAYVVSAFAMAALLLGSAGGIVVAVSRHYGSRPPFVRARLARSLATSIEAGMPLGRALPLSANASGSEDVRRHVGRASERVLSTQSIVTTLAGCPHLTPDFIAVVDTAERTGNFAALTRLAELYEDGFR